MIIGESSKSVQKLIANKRRKIYLTIEATDLLTNTHAPSQTETWLQAIPTNNTYSILAHINIDEDQPSNITIQS